jgi:hypothetical protein
LEAFILAIIIHTILRIARQTIIGIPIIIKQSGIASTIYSSIDNWKFKEFLPLTYTQPDSSLFDNQQIRGPNVPPKGKKKPANAER